MTIIEVLEHEFEFINEKIKKAVQFMEEAKQYLKKDKWSAKNKFQSSITL